MISTLSHIPCSYCIPPSPWAAPPFLLPANSLGPRTSSEKRLQTEQKYRTLLIKYRLRPRGKKKKTTKPKSKIKLKTTQITMRLAREQRRNVTVGDEARRSIQVLLNLTRDHGRINTSKECTLRRSISGRHAKWRSDSGIQGLRGSLPGIQTPQRIGTMWAGTVTAGRITAPREQISPAIRRHRPHATHPPPTDAARRAQPAASRKP